jgi:hypothetical protein
MQVIRHWTRDGGMDQHGVKFYLLARMADPNEQVTVVDWEPKGASLIDGQPLIRYIVEKESGERFVVEPWQLSQVPADELYRLLRMRSAPASLCLPVTSVRLSA